MKIRTIFLLFISLSLMSFGLSKRIQKKVHKEIKKTFKVDNFQLDPIAIEDSVNQQLSKKVTKNNLFSIRNNQKNIGFAFIDTSPSKTDEFDYLILLDENFIIKKTKILIYREDYGGEIGSTRWLKQFIGKTSADKLRYEKDIIAISGATISAYSMTVSVNQFLQNLKILLKNNAL